MSFAKQLADHQADRGIAHRQPRDGAERIDESEFVQHAMEAFRSGYSDRFSDEQVQRAAEHVAQQWSAQGRTIEPTRDWAERLAAETGNLLSGAGPGIQMYAGAAPSEPEAPASGSLSDALLAHQRERGLTRY